MFIYFNLLLFYYADDFLQIGYAYWMRTGGCKVSSITATPATHGNTVHDDGHPPQQGFFARDEREQELKRPHQITRDMQGSKTTNGAHEGEGMERRRHGRAKEWARDSVSSPVCFSSFFFPCLCYPLFLIGYSYIHHHHHTQKSRLNDGRRWPPLYDPSIGVFYVLF